MENLNSSTGNLSQTITRLNVLKTLFNNYDVNFHGQDLKYVKISPETAKVLVGEQINCKNRKLTASTVKVYQNQMDNDEWVEYTAEAIKISSSGTLIDGQHRLQALVNAGKTYDFLIATGLTEKTIHVLDTGKKRSPGDVLNINGVEHSSIKSSAITTYFHIKKNKKAVVGKHNAREGFYNQKVWNEFESRSSYWNELYTTSYGLFEDINRIVKVSFIMGWMAALSDIDKPKAIEFMTSLCTGYDKDGNKLEDTNPIRQLSSFFAKKNANKYMREVSGPVKANYMIKTWHLFMTNKTVGKLSVKQNEYIEPLFPSIDN